MQEDNENVGWIKKDAKIFLPGGNMNEYSYFGWGKTTTQFYGYIMGYKDAADILIEDAIHSDSNMKLDTLIFPVLFLYRHSIELYLKRIYLELFDENLNEKKTFLKKRGHNLLAVWEKVRIIIERYSMEEEKKDIPIAEEYIKQINQIDENSFNFRYPITKDLKSIHSESQIINLPNLKERMNEILIFLEAIYYAIIDRKNQETEFLLNSLPAKDHSFAEENSTQM